MAAGAPAGGLGGGLTRRLSGGMRNAEWRTWRPKDRAWGGAGSALLQCKACTSSRSGRIDGFAVIAGGRSRIGRLGQRFSAPHGVAADMLSFSGARNGKRKGGEGNEEDDGSDRGNWGVAGGRVGGLRPGPRLWRGSRVGARGRLWPRLGARAGPGRGRDPGGA